MADPFPSHFVIRVTYDLVWIFLDQVPFLLSVQYIIESSSGIKREMSNRGSAPCLHTIPQWYNSYFSQPINNRHPSHNGFLTLFNSSPLITTINSITEPRCMVGWVRRWITQPHWLKLADDVLGIRTAQRCIVLNNLEQSERPASLLSVIPGSAIRHSTPLYQEVT